MPKRLYLSINMQRLIWPSLAQEEKFNIYYVGARKTSERK